MSYVHSSLPTSRSGGLLGVVVAAHVGLAALILATKTVLPQIMESPLIVELIEASPLPLVARAKPSPTLTPTPPVPQKKVAPPQKTPQPQLETTSSTAPASDNAPVVSVAERAPATPAVSGGSPAASEGGMVQARFDADYLRNPAPPYPPASRRFGEEGKVILRVRVSPEGGAEQVEIKTSSGSPRLDDSAQRTVRTWKFIPAKRGGAPVESWVLVPIHFKLEQ